MKELTKEQLKVHTSVKNMLRDLFDTKIKVHNWKYDFRASSIPFCQWYVCLSRLYEKYPNEIPPNTTGFLFDYYVSVGNCVHTLFQRWLGKFGYLYGDYRCSTCGFLVKGNLGWPATCPTKNCPGSFWEYVELTLQDYTLDIGLKSAHCDGLLHFPWMDPKHYYLTDFKTCSLRTLPSPQERFTDPNHIKYLTQTGFYHYILTNRMNMLIDGTIFLMVPRDSPVKTTPILYNQNSMSERMFKAVVEEYKAAEHAAKTGDLSCIVKACQNSHEKDECPFNEACFNPRVMKEDIFPIFHKVFGKDPILE